MWVSAKLEQTFQLVKLNLVTQDAQHFVFFLQPETNKGNIKILKEKYRHVTHLPACLLRFCM